MCSVHVRMCTDAPIALSKPHIISISAHVTNLSTISSTVPKIMTPFPMGKHGYERVSSGLTPVARITRPVSMD